MTYEELVKWIFSLPHRYPVSFDGDIYCPRCGEPWNGWSVYNDMADEEVEKFFYGKGCPCCEREVGED